MTLFDVFRAFELWQVAIFLAAGAFVVWGRTWFS